MLTLRYQCQINATPQKVWSVLWDDATYPQWTSVFMEGSYAESSWEEGSRINFLTPEGSGMFSRIERKKPAEEMLFRHLGEIKNGVEEPKGWKDATEQYLLQHKDNGTELQVVVTMDEGGDAMENYFNTTFPKALDKLKSICENGA